MSDNNKKNNQHQKRATPKILTLDEQDDEMLDGMIDEEEDNMHPLKAAWEHTKTSRGWR